MLAMRMPCGPASPAGVALSLLSLSGAPSAGEVLEVPGQVVRAELHVEGPEGFSSRLSLQEFHE